MLQEEQSCNQSEVGRLRSDLDAKEAELREAEDEMVAMQRRLEEENKEKNKNNPDS